MPIKTKWGPCYIARFPVFGPYALAFAYNLHTAPRKVSVWAYLVS
jgi:hypothetical protein